MNDTPLSLRTFSAYADSQPLLIFTKDDGTKWAGVPEIITPTITYDKDFSQVLKFVIQFDWLCGISVTKGSGKNLLQERYVHITGTFQKDLSLIFKDVAYLEERETCLTLACQCQQKGKLEIHIGPHATTLVHHLLVA